MKPKSIFGLGAVCTLCACGGPEPYSITIYGEAFIEDSIPAADMADGWAVEFDTFLIAVSGLRAGDTAVDGAYVFDLTESSGGDGHPVVTVDAESDIAMVSYTVAPVASAQPGNVDDSASAELESMNTGLYVAGTATREDVTKTFAWALDTSTTYSACAVDPSARTAELTIHSDHLFYDDLESEEPDLRFDLLAQADDDGDADGQVTAEELAAVDITALQNYQVGSRDIDNLWDFVLAQSQTLGHINGEGHCDTP